MKISIEKEGRVWLWSVYSAEGELLGAGYCRTKRAALNDAAIFAR
jgi:hypothetical protein